MLAKFENDLSICNIYVSYNAFVTKIFIQDCFIYAVYYLIFCWITKVINSSLINCSEIIKLQSIRNSIFLINIFFKIFEIYLIFCLFQFINFRFISDLYLDSVMYLTCIVHDPRCWNLPTIPTYGSHYLWDIYNNFSLLISSSFQILDFCTRVKILYCIIISGYNFNFLCWYICWYI